MIAREVRASFVQYLDEPVVFMRRSDIRDLFVVNNLPVPVVPNTASPDEDDISF